MNEFLGGFPNDTFGRRLKFKTVFCSNFENLLYSET